MDILFSDTEFCYNSSVAFDVFLGQIIEKTAAFADHLQKARGGCDYLLRESSDAR